MNFFESPTRVLGLALGAGAVLGTAVAVSRYAYDGGASGIVVATIRTIIMTVTMAVGLKLLNISLKMPREMVVVSIVNGALMAIMTYGNVGAVEFISVGLASLLFFTFPIIIAVFVVILGIEEVRPAKMATVIVAFVGLAVMLGSSIGNVDIRGTLFALTAALTTAISSIVVMKYFRQVNVFVATLHFSLWGFVVLAAIALTIGDVRFPVTASGWAGTIGVGVLQTIGTPMYLYAIARIGALKVGMATNVQPVVAIAEAWLWFGEVLTLAQALGGLLVLAAVGAMQWLDFRRQAGATKGAEAGR